VANADDLVADSVFGENKIGPRQHERDGEPAD